MYSEQYMYHVQSPLFVGDIPDATVQADVCYEEDGCMDRICLYLKLDEGVIRDVRFRARGCSGTVAACSAMCTLIAGRRVENAAQLDSTTIALELGGIPQNKEHSLALAKRALARAVEQIPTVGETVVVHRA